MHQPHTPKLAGASAIGRSHWYPYYAGYAPQFVADVLRGFGLGDEEKHVLDPWNGSGTTTTICSLNGVFSTGFDVNPVMVLVAKARLLDRNVADSLIALLDALLDHSRNFSERRTQDPLDAWFTPGTAMRIRSVQHAILDLLASSKSVQPIDTISSIAAFFHVLLFRLVRSASKKQAVTNPTWTKTRSAPEDAVRLSFAQIGEMLRSDLASIRLLDRSNPRPRVAEADVLAADSCELPLAEGSVDAVISSPPYCTRIDYAVSTRMELAVLGLDHHAGEDLRRKMIGTTLTNRVGSGLPQTQHAYVETLLEKIRRHPSKASSTYYFRTFQDYFEKLSMSYGEIARVLRKV